MQLQKECKMQIIHRLLKLQTPEEKVESLISPSFPSQKKKVERIKGGEVRINDTPDANHSNKIYIMSIKSPCID